MVVESLFYPALLEGKNLYILSKFNLCTDARKEGLGTTIAKACLAL